MSKTHIDEDEKEEFFYKSLDRILSSTSTTSTSCSKSESDNDPQFIVPKLPMAVSKYDVWISEPTASISERRSVLLCEMGLSRDPGLSRVKTPNGFHSNGDINRSLLSSRLSKKQGESSSIVRSKSDGCDNTSGSSGSGDSSILSIRCNCNCASSCSRYGLPCVNNSSSSSNYCYNERKSNAGVVVKSQSGKSDNVLLLPPSGKNCSRRSDYENPNDHLNSSTVLERNSNSDLECNGISSTVVGDEHEHEHEHEPACTIKNLDTEKEFVVNEIREDGMWNKLKEVGTGRQLTDRAGR